MTLKETTDNVIAAVRDRDLPSLAAALGDRAQAIKAGAQPTPEIVEAGNRAMYEVLVLKQSLAFENARLEQVKAGLTAALHGGKRPSIEYRG